MSFLGINDTALQLGSSAPFCYVKAVVRKPENVTRSSRPPLAHSFYCKFQYNYAHACAVSTRLLFLIEPGYEATGKATDFTFEEIVKKVKEHHCPKPSQIAQRFKFNTRVQGATESISEFVAELRSIATYCEFKDATITEMMRDRLVCGVRDKRLQQRLLAEPDNVAFDKALKLAQSFEAAEKDVKDMQRHDPSGHVSAQVNKATHKQQQPPSHKPSSCFRCGANHNPSTCRFKQEQCHSCGKTGHIAKVCRSKPKPRPEKKLKTHKVEESSTSPSEYTLFPVKDAKSSPLQTTVKLDGHSVTMEIDTGASVSLISEATFRKIWGPQPPHLQASTVTLHGYGGEQIPVVGSLNVTVQHCQQTEELSLTVVAGDGPSLLGRDWLAKIKLDWKRIMKLDERDQLQQILERHAAVFAPGLGKVEGVEVKLQVNTQVPPKFCKARPLPFALRQRVEKELDRLEAEQVIAPVQFSEWAAPIVPVTKSNGSVRICGDYKLTANQATKTEVYPLPRIEELFTSLTGGTCFSKLDLSHAYLQLSLAEESQPYLTINTHRGLYRYKRLPFGVASAPAIFQRTMESLLQGIPHVCVYIDDILITGSTEQEHLHNLEAVLNRLQKVGMKLKKEKCEFLAAEVEYLGHRISKEGLQPTEAKVRAITEAPDPQNVTELKSFLGLVNYYSRFLPNLATTLSPLYALLHKNTPWRWRKEHKEAVQQVKAMLKSPDVLVHYDPDKPLVLTCDASPYGVGAVLSHSLDDKSDRPVAYASRSLSAVERRYSQLDKEALAIVYGVKQFHQYLCGRVFQIYSDHKPLMYLFNESKGVPTMASARVQRWALTLSAYNYRIRYKKGSEVPNADALSRLPLPDVPDNVPIPAEHILLMEHLSNTPASATQIRTMTHRNPTLAKIKTYVQQGRWPSGSNSDPETQPYWRRKDELSLEDGCLLWGQRVIVPPRLREKVLSELHETHPGICRTKALARQYVWWPRIDDDLESLVKKCAVCQQSRPNPPAAPLHPWEWPHEPWTRIHADYAGPFMGRMFLVIVDSHTKWMEVHITGNSTAQTTIDKMRTTFAALGIPEQVVSDNGPAFKSEEFKEFLRKNCVRHSMTSPYHPASNGLAERAVQTLKSGLKKMRDGNLETRLARFLFWYRTTPHATTGVSPAELLFGRRLRSPLDKLKPELSRNVRHRQENQKSNHDYHAKERDISPGCTVYAKNFGRGKPWLSGVVEEEKGPVSFMIKLSDGRKVNPLNTKLSCWNFNLVNADQFSRE